MSQISESITKRKRSERRISVRLPLGSAAAIPAASPSKKILPAKIYAAAEPLSAPAST